VKNLGIGSTAKRTDISMNQMMG